MIQAIKKFAADSIILVFSPTNLSNLEPIPKIDRNIAL